MYCAGGEAHLWESIKFHERKANSVLVLLKKLLGAITFIVDINAHSK